MIRTLYSHSVMRKSILTYIISLLVVSVIFYQYKLDFQWVVWGCVEVLLFFYFSHRANSKWKYLNPNAFIKKVFWIAVVLRIFFVFFSYYYFEAETGRPFEYGDGDSINYHWKAQWILEMFRTNNVKEYWKFLKEELSDAGYASYVALIYSFTDESIVVVRLLKAVWSSLTCVFIYKIANRNFGEDIGRLSAILCVFMPNFILYCGLHLKETEMVFLTVFFIERADYFLRQKTFSVGKILNILLLATVTFSFRTVLGAVLFLSFGVTIFFSSKQLINISKRILISVISIIFVGLLVVTSPKIYTDVQQIVEIGGSEQQQNMEWRSIRKDGNAFAKYAGAAVFAPLIFTIPFPTMVETPGQEHQKMLNGGNYCKNVFSFFIIVAVISLLLSGNWRKHVLSITFFVGYLLVLVLSSYAHSERFHMPVLPLAMVFISYGLSFACTQKGMKYFNIWLIFLFFAVIVWNWFKLAGRNMI